MIFDTEIHSSSDARRLAKRRLPWMVFDYIDGAAGEGYGEALNRQALQNTRLQPRVLNNVEHRNLGVDIFGQGAKLPFGISPMGMCNLSAPGADLMLARLAAEDRIPLGVSTAASTSLEKMIEAAEGNAWFQLYFGGDEDISNQLLKRAEKAEYKTLVLTVDVPEVGRRPRELRRGFKMPFRLGVRQLIDLALHPRWSLPTLFHGRPQLANFGGDFGQFDRTVSRAGADWAFLDRVRATWKGNLVIKGVLSVVDAQRLINTGVDAIQVSSHGGRQLDAAPPAIEILGDIRRMAGDGIPLFYDSGIRSGEDVVKAYAMGADFVFLGRPLLFAMAGGGEKGLRQMRDVFAAETSITLAQLGVTEMFSLSQDVLIPPA
jgi:isopentenyl diphosphate isomerase/L-lactate dehydrogenase-like FMN-dependent dehydrogenase